MIATKHNGYCARNQYLAHAKFDIGVALLGIGVDNVSIADIDDPAIGQVGGIVLMIVGAGMAEGKKRRGLPDRARTETRAGAPLRAAVKRCAQNRDIGLDIIPIEL